MTDQNEIVVVDQIEPLIITLRGQKVLLDHDLASVYGVITKRLNQQVRRNVERFPADFVFQLTVEEMESLRLQNATSKAGSGGRRYLPFAFTEHGAIMAATVLNTPRAIAVSVFVVRAFIRMREVLTTHKELAHKLAELERVVGTHDEAIRTLIAAMHKLMAPLPDQNKGRIGFGRELDPKQRNS
jgi:ORF6N domain